MEQLSADYEALRTGCGALESVRDVIVVEGPQAAEYLQGQCSQDLSALAPGGAVETLVLEPDGKLVAWARVLRRAEDAFVLETDPGSGPGLGERLVRFRLRTKVTIESAEWPVVRLRGPACQGLVGPTGRSGSGPDAERWALTVEWGGAVGVDVLGPGADRPAAARAVSTEAFEAVRIEAGVPVMGRELVARTIPAELGARFLERTVSFSKGCYTGQELVARMDARGNRAPRRLAGLVLEGPGPEDPASFDGATLLRADEDPESAKEAGRVTSAAWCPGLGAVGGLGYVHRTVSVGDSVTVATGPLSGRSVAVRELPLVPGPD